MPFGITPIAPTIPRDPPEFAEFIQFQSDGLDLSGPTVEIVNFLSPLKATRGVGENADVITVNRPDIPFITVSLTGVQASDANVGSVSADPPLFYVPFTGNVADDVTANPAPATVGAGAIISGNAFQSQSPPTIDSTCGISWASAKLAALASGDFTLSGTFNWTVVSNSTFRRIMRLDFGSSGAFIDIGFKASGSQRSVTVDTQPTPNAITSGATLQGATTVFALSVARSGTDASGTGTLYLDGVSAGSALVFCPTALPITVLVGPKSDQGGENFSVDDLRLWDSQRPLG